jgi:hypothetical protein
LPSGARRARAAGHDQSHAETVSSAASAGSRSFCLLRSEFDDHIAARDEPLIAQPLAHSMDQ